MQRPFCANSLQTDNHTGLAAAQDTNNIQKYWHKENDGLITLGFFGNRERELIKSGFGFGLDLTEGDGMA